MIGNGIDIFYICQPVDSSDQAESLAAYLNQHGLLAYPSEGGDHAVEVPIQAPNRDAVADQTATVHMVISSWKLYWDASDGVLFNLPIYTKDD